ncbi:MAG: hypothetical protein HRT90_00530 [Candidatus Margulisbacteria bacterium]|nr:hypothetical protein [Candidatus Margulisiibacteriota bacterium]
MKKKHNSEGFGLIFLLIIMVLFMSMATSLFRSYRLSKLASSYQFSAAKVHYLAQSGLAYVRNFNGELPVLEGDPLSPDVYLKGHLLNTSLEGTIYLFKSTQNRIISVAIYDEIYKSVLSLSENPQTSAQYIQL